MGGQYAGMGGQHDPEWGVSIVRNLHSDEARKTATVHSCNPLCVTQKNRQLHNLLY